MMYLRWLALAPISLAFNLFCIVTSPLWALWAAAAKIDKLPGIFAWVHTHDEDIYGYETPRNFVDRWKAATRWVARNPGYGLDAFLLGFRGPVTFEDGSDNYQDYKFDTGENALRFEKMRTADGKRFFSYRRDIKLGGGRYIKLWLGWQTRNQAGRHMFKIDFNPFKRAEEDDVA